MYTQPSAFLINAKNEIQNNIWISDNTSQNSYTPGTTGKVVIDGLIVFEVQQLS